MGSTSAAYAEAKPLFQRGLAIQETALGPEHPNVGTSLENYAALLREVGRGAEAVEMAARPQAIRAKSADVLASRFVGPRLLVVRVSGFPSVTSGVCIGGSGGSFRSVSLSCCSLHPDNESLNSLGVGKRGFAILLVRNAMVVLQ